MDPDPGHDWGNKWPPNNCFKSPLSSISDFLLEGVMMFWPKGSLWVNTSRNIVPVFDGIVFDRYLDAILDRASFTYRFQKVGDDAFC